MSSYNILNPFSEKVKQIQASLVASNLLCEISLDGTKLYEENIMLIESKTNLTSLEIGDVFIFLHLMSQYSSGQLDLPAKDI